MYRLRADQAILPRPHSHLWAFRLRSGLVGAENGDVGLLVSA